MINGISIVGLLISTVVFVLYVIMCDVIATAAKKQGVSYWKIGAVSFIGTPILGALLTLIELHSGASN